MSEDTRWAIIQRLDAALVQMHGCGRYTPEDVDELENAAWDVFPLLKAQEPDESKYEYHTDHTDCPWYISGEESKCPVTCSQYRDGWNDAMNYIFRNGNGYRPYDRIRKGGAKWNG